MTNPEASEPDADVVVFGEVFGFWHSKYLQQRRDIQWAMRLRMPMQFQLTFNPYTNGEVSSASSDSGMKQAMTLSRYPGGSLSDHFSWLLVRIEVEMDSLSKRKLNWERHLRDDEWILQNWKTPENLLKSHWFQNQNTQLAGLFSEYRPTSLVHGLNENIVTKLLSTRLKVIIPSVISANQIAFSVGRQILYGFMIADEVVQWEREVVVMGSF
ncbi:hypothetical protein DKX38_007882 [Salix brachista]|uniref:Uncharacterized protein n=1 Tax=Salix brachista TaxID=2182728 RepID=A0A5N5MRB1_9ROSI|nr:hypothetical protein DKX38_007882 [Salix brachista]